MRTPITVSDPCTLRIGGYVRRLRLADLRRRLTEQSANVADDWTLFRTVSALTQYPLSITFAPLNTVVLVLVLCY